MNDRQREEFIRDVNRDRVRMEVLRPTPPLGVLAAECPDAGTPWTDCDVCKPLGGLRQGYLAHKHLAYVSGLSSLRDPASIVIPGEDFDRIVAEMERDADRETVRRITETLAQRQGMDR